MFPKPPVYALRIDGVVKAVRTPDLAEARALAQGFSVEGRKVDVVDVTTGKVITA